MKLSLILIIVVSTVLETESRTVTPVTWTSSETDQPAETAPTPSYRLAVGQEGARLGREEGTGDRRDERNLWQPSNGTRGDWFRCHGMPCDQWRRLQRKMREIFRLEHPEQDVPEQYGGSFDLVNSYIPEDDGTLDGCVWLTEPQADDIISLMKRQHPDMQHGRRIRRKRKFTSNGFSRWTKFPIVYKFDGAHTEGEKKIIRDAFQHWMDQTCIVFKEVGTHEIVRDNHLLMTRNSTGCHSFVGKVFFRPQQINLQFNCMWEFGIPVHEIGHSLGLWHEQQRADRDQTIRVLWENVGYYKGQFAKIDTRSFGVPYDVGSIMHYAPKDGAVNGQNSMQTLDPLFQQSMGQKTGASFLDVMIMNNAYCSNICRFDAPLAQPCQRSGYRDPKDCSRCRCPPGFSGRFCETVAPPKGAQCGGEIRVTSTPQTITSPGYTWPGYYNDHVQCNWLIKAPAGRRVELRFEDRFGVYSHSQGQCHHWVEVRYSDTIGLPGPRFCSYKTPSVVLQSKTDEMAVIFESNYTTAFRTARKGFKAVIVAVSSNGDSGRDNGLNPTSRPTTKRAATTTTTTATTTTTTTTRTPPTTRRPTPTTTNSQSDSWTWRCDFETRQNRRDWCEITQERNDQFDWTIQRGGTPSGLTGPRRAYNGEYYVYIETSNPRRRGDQARFLLPRFGRQGSHCLEFAYHMYGFHVNTLEMFVDTARGRKVQWKAKGEKGDRWLLRKEDVYLSSTDRIGFKGIRGGEYSGDIALDRISIRSGNC